MARAMALSLAEADKTSSKSSKKDDTRAIAEGEKSSDKSSKKDDTTDTHVPPTTSTTATVNTDPPPRLKKKRSGNPNEPKDSNSLVVAPNPPPGFKKKQSNNYETEFPVMVKAPESVPSAPSLPYGNLIESNIVTNEGFPTLDNKPVAPPPGFGKKVPNSEPQPEKKEPIVKRLRDLLGNDKKFEQFKIWSSKYRMSEISAEKYEDDCCKLFGDQQWNDIFDELVATFPDEQGQDDLIKAHQNHDDTKATKKSKAKAKKNHTTYRPLTAWGPGNNMVGDRMNDELYPPLSAGTSSVQPPPAKWGRKVAVK